MKFVVFVAFMILVTVIVGVTGGVGLRILNLAERRMYTDQLLPFEQISDINENVLTMSATFDMAILAHGNDDEIAGYREEVNQLHANTQELFKTFRTNSLPAQLLNDFSAGEKAYTDHLAARYPEVFDKLQSGDVDGAEQIMGQIDGNIDLTLEHFQACKTSLVQSAQTQRGQNMWLIRILAIILAAVLLVGATGSILFGRFLSKNIYVPVEFLTQLLTQIGRDGNLRLSAQKREQLLAVAARKDEFGQNAQAISIMFDALEEKANALDNVAQGDISMHDAVHSDEDTIGDSLQSMVLNLNQLIAQIRTMSNQVKQSSTQISTVSQSLAQGASEQRVVASGLLDNISDIKEKTHCNTVMAQNAFEINTKAKGDAGKGSERMNRLMEAVEQINNASRSIQKVIHVIDDIAFQTNILALNASVEAARAGEHGKGFAVVADEVRNLAAKSADAAKDTEKMINNSIELAKLGSEIAVETAQSLDEIIAGINQSSEIVEGISASTTELGGNTSVISEGIDRMNMVIEQNGSLAQELAAANDNMLEQTSSLTEIIARFKLADGNLKR